MIRKLRADAEGPHGHGYWGRLYVTAPELRPLLAAWADRTGAEARKLFASTIGSGRRLLNEFINGQGTYNHDCHYWLCGAYLAREAQSINGLLILIEMDPSVLSAADKTKLKQLASLYSYIIWDDDFVPLSGEHMLNLGNASMPIMQLGYRDLYALMLADHPAFKSRAASVKSRTLERLATIVNEHGSAIGSTNYIPASFTPTLNVLHQIKIAGIADLLAPKMPSAQNYAKMHPCR
jgi:hypothetical protein